MKKRPYSTWIHTARWPALGALVALAAAAGTAWSAYEKPIQWSDISSLDLRSVFRSDYNAEGNLYTAKFEPSAIDFALRDADERISRDFRVPEGMRDSVAFWLKVYAELSSRQIIVY